MDFWIGVIVGLAVLPAGLMLLLLVEFIGIGAEAFRMSRAVARSSAADAIRSHIKEQLVRTGRAREVMAAERREQAEKPTPPDNVQWRNGEQPSLMADPQRIGLGRQENPQANVELHPRTDPKRYQ